MVQSRIARYVYAFKGSMKITHHITFFYLEQRIPFINRNIQKANTYAHAVGIFTSLTIDTVMSIY